MAHILVAEDERDIRELIKFTLTFAGHKITEASNGEEAVKLAKEVLPDLILTDVRMPKMTGYEACKAIKSEETTKHIPVVILSAKGQDEEIDQGRESGANDYILKPFDPAKLQSRVAEILEKMAAGLMGAPSESESNSNPNQ
jgi:CheY-like chemotaxis protein